MPGILDTGPRKTHYCFTGSRTTGLWISLKTMAWSWGGLCCVEKVCPNTTLHMRNEMFTWSPTEESITNTTDLWIPVTSSPGRVKICLVWSYRMSHRCHFRHITVDDATDMPYAAGLKMLHTLANISALYQTPVSQCLDVIKPSRTHGILQLWGDWEKRRSAS